MGERVQLARRSRGFVAALGMLVVCGCGGGTGPTHVPPPPGAPTVSCPANIEAFAHNGTPPNVTFDTPVAQGGQSPVSVACAPASNTTFQVGTEPVVCTATDSRGQTGNCTFDVTVNAVPVIAKTNFMAFGDSLTEGTTSPAPMLLTTNPSDSYPFKLQAMLAERYLDQTITMANEGRAGRKAKEDVSRFADALRADHPQAVLLLEGANDLNTYGDDGISGVLGAFEKMIKEAKSHGAEVFLATLPPQDPAGKNGHSADLVPQLNRGIAATAADEGARLVDLYGQMGTYVGYIGVDGLHPTPEGYTKIAEIWRDAIQAAYEQPATPAPSISAPEPTGFRRRR
jgi:lysophospholipase L1-like esterase